MAEYMERNVTLIRNLIEDNKTYKHVSEILRQNFPEVTRGFSERNVRLFCAKYGIRRLNEFEVDSIVQDCVNEVSLFLFLQFVWIGTFHFYSCLPLWMSKFLPPHFFVGKKNFSYPIIFVGPFENGFLATRCLPRILIHRGGGTE